ncbi:MAG: tetratricopeptide repeat protein [Pseudomonadota bacterium]
MSLLLEALKKAELAKQAAKEQPPATDKPPFTRDKLPDISQPMEIRSEDLSLVDAPPAPAHANKPVLELALEEPPRAAPPPPRALPLEEPEYSAPSEIDERKQAQQLFEAKEMDVNPRKPFYITVGALVLFALGTVGYFWYELQPKNNYKIPPPLAQSAAPPVAAPPMAAAPAAGPAVPAASTLTPPSGSQPALATPAASAPGATAAGAAPAGVQTGERSAAPLRRAAPATTAASAPQRSARREGDIKITPARIQTDPVLQSAYQAFNSGDMARAREDYQQVLRASPNNRDALLGLAAVEMQSRRYAAAESFYTRLIELDPRDAHAQAGLIGLKGQSDPVSAESRLKNMIAAQPEASFLNFTLGNQYASQDRWAEAQQAYFRAYTGDPEHPDFAYNLAVSLDKLHQTKAALEYYRRALKLAEARPVTFDQAQVNKRVSQLAN